MKHQPTVQPRLDDEIMQHCLKNHAALFQKSCSIVSKIMQHCFKNHGTLIF